MAKSLKPIFIFSLARSGSTLLQKLLMTHDEIDSTAETWVLLPLISPMKKKGLEADYDHSIAHVALMDVMKNLNDKSIDYNDLMRNFVLSIYQGLSDGKSTFFIDKTPRYFMIIPEIVKIFPEAKFIFLFRNPVNIYSSMISTWRNNTLKYSKFVDYDLKQGSLILSQSYNLLKDKSYALQYESLVEDPEKYLKQITNYLGLEYQPKMIKNFFHQDLKGQSHDPTGILKYNNVSTLTLNKWKKVFNTFYRKRVLLKFIENLDDKVFLIQGYNKEGIINEIKEMKSNGSFNLFKDLYDFNSYKIKKRISNFIKNNFK